MTYCHCSFVRILCITYLFYILSICTNAIPNDRSEGRKYINLYVYMFLNVFDEHNSFANQRHVGYGFLSVVIHSSFTVCMYVCMYLYKYIFAYIIIYVNRSEFSNITACSYILVV